MSLNPKYITAPSLQQYFVDKDTGAPLSGGKVFFYRDTNRTEPKTVYEIQGNAANYTYSPLPNPIILSAVGTIVDNNGNDVIPYYYPEDADGEQDLYYIVVQNSLGVPQFTRPAWPNPEAGGGENANDVINYVPNGQFLAHNNFEDNLMLAGSNPIAQGGWSIELDDPALVPASVNTLTFITEPYTQDPPQSPRFTANFVCTSPNDLETTKILRLKFNDVNKFTDQEPFTFAFWMSSTFSVPFSVSVYRDFGTGGSSPVTSNTQLATSTTTGTMFNFELDFDTNAGYNIGDNNDDFVAIDIAFPTDIAFDVQFTDFVLSNQTTEVISSFPIQTNANMLTNSLNGWVSTPDPDGMDLYLPQILTMEGMRWDDSSIGTVGYELFPIDDPESTSPIPNHNKLPCDGASYSFSGRSANGIPYARLGAYMLKNTDLVYNAEYDLPLAGTGYDFVSALIDPNGAPTNGLRITANLTGTPTPLASDGNTGFTFSPMYVYNGSTTGSSGLNYFSSKVSAATDTVLCELLTGNPLNGEGAGTSGFTITEWATSSSPKAFQQNSFLVTALAASTLITGAAGKYFTFSNASTDFYMWFNTGTESDPAVVGRTPIQVNVPTTFSAAGVADLIREAMNALQSTQIITLGITPPPQSSYFLFSSNPGSLRNFYVWFNKDGAGVDPAIAGKTGIEVEWTTADNVSATYTRDQIRRAINRTVQFATPDLRGVFLRCADPNKFWDLDADYRFSLIASNYGNNPGTYEFQQFLSHYHSDTGYDTNNTGSSGPKAVAAVGTTSTLLTDSSGGTETRPVNYYVYPYIRY